MSSKDVRLIEEEIGQAAAQGDYFSGRVKSVAAESKERVFLIHESGDGGRDRGKTMQVVTPLNYTLVEMETNHNDLSNVSSLTEPAAPTIA